MLSTHLFKTALLPRQYVVFNQQSLKETYEKISQAEFTGACVGVCASFAEKIIFLAENQFNNNDLIPNPMRCVQLQRCYEHDHENFLACFVRDTLHISETGYPDNDDDLFCQDFESLLSKMEIYDSIKNSVLFINITCELSTQDHQTFCDEHMLVFIKHNAKYYFCEPNKIMAAFSEAREFETWMINAAQSGPLKYLTQSSMQKIVIANHDGSASVIQGERSVKSLKVFSYHYEMTRRYRFARASL